MAHWSEINNGNGNHRGPFRLAGMTSRLEVRHSPRSMGVSYSCHWG
jgi:hypothetical protein